MKSKAGDMRKVWRKQESRISKEWKKMKTRNRTVFTQDMIEEDVGGFAAHKQRISDYLNDGSWHHVSEEGAWVFRDAEADSIDSYIGKMHLRYLFILYFAMNLLFLKVNEHEHHSKQLPP